MHDAGSATHDGVGDLVRTEATAQQAERRALARQLGGVSCEQLRLLAEPLPHEPHEVLDDALLATGYPVAVVDEEDHCAVNRRMSGVPAALREAPSLGRIPNTHPLRPTASIVIPTRARPRYLEVALASIAPQAAEAGAEVIVVDDDGPGEQQRALVERFGARYVAHERPLGLNHARNTGVQRTSGELVVFVDDDVEVSPDWLKGLLRAAGAYPDVAVFTGPIHPRLEGRAPRSCGRERPPLTSLDLGSQDSDRVRFAWGTNMTIRRSALDRVGPFEESLRAGGDEQEWQERLHASGDGRTMYIAAAGLYHRRSADDVGLRPLMRTALARGRAARRFDAFRGEAPARVRELATLVSCFGHVVIGAAPRA